MFIFFLVIIRQVSFDPNLPYIFISRVVRVELLPRVELGTSSLPRMRSTTELKQHESGKRDSNPRPPAWKASALSTELFPQDFRENLAGLSLFGATYVAVGADGFEPPKLKSSRFTVCPIWPLWNTPPTSFQCSLCA